MTQSLGYCLVPTALGEFGLVWTGAEKRGELPLIAFLQFPEASSAKTKARILAVAPGAKQLEPPKLVAAVIKKLKRHLAGDLQSFADVALALDGVPPFAQEVYLAAQAVPAGKTITYGELAARLGKPGAARAVGTALGRNPVGVLIPCHRVMAAGGKPGGFSAPGGLATKALLLDVEGAQIGPPRVLRSNRDLQRAAKELQKLDPRLGECLSRRVDFVVREPKAPYETLFEAIVHQQLSPKAAATIFGRIKALGPGGKLLKPEALLKTPDTALRGAGLSGSKTKAVKDLAAKTLDGTVPTAKEILLLSDREIIDRLTSIYGIGQWSVEMLLIFNLGRSDVLPVDDFAVRKAVGQVLGMKVAPTAKELRELGKLWRPHRTAASLHFWNWLTGVGPTTY